MASSYSDLGIELMATGENAGTWGTKTNTNLQIVEKAIAGYVEQAVTSGGTTALSITDGDATESTSVARHAVIKLTGTITGNSIVTVPDSIEKVYIVTNGTSGAYTVQFKTASGTGITFGVSEKTTRLVYSDGTNLVDAGFGGSLDLEGRELVLDADGDTTITADTDDQIDIKIAGADDFQFTANTFTAQSGSTIAAQALTATTIVASSTVQGTTITATTAFVPDASDGAALGTSSLEFSDLFLADGAIVNFGDDQDVSLTHVADTGLLLSSTDQLQFGDSGTYIHQSADGVLDLVSDTEIEINATTIDINGAVAMDGAITGATNITLSGELDAATGDFSGDVDVDGTLEADAITINGTAIGSIYGAVAGSSSIVTTGALDSGSITSGFGNIDTGSSTITTTGLITGGSLDIDDVLINGTTIGHTDDTDLITLANGVATVAGEISVTTLDIGGTNVTATAAEINLIDGGTARGTTAVADGDGLLVNDAGTMRMTNVTTLKTYFQTGISSAADDISAGDAAVSITTSSGDITIDAAANNSDIIFKGTDATSDITMLTLDGSEAGAATFNDKVVATELDISGNIDIDGTANLDAVDIDGAVQLDATLTIGADDQGYDVILYGDTASANMTWDTSVDDLIFNGAARIVIPDGQLVLGSTAVSSTAAELNLLDGVSGLVQADLTKLAAVDSTAAELNIVDGGTSATSTTVADADRVVLNDNGTMVQVAMTDIKTYIGGGTSWQAVKTSNFTAAAGQGVFCNTTSAAFTLTLPASPSIGDEVSFVDYAGTFDTNNLTIGRNSQKIHGASEDLTVAVERAANTLVFTDSTQGWLLKSK